MTWITCSFWPTLFRRSFHGLQTPILDNLKLCSIKIWILERCVIRIRWTLKLNWIELSEFQTKLRTLIFGALLQKYENSLGIVLFCVNAPQPCASALLLNFKTNRKIFSQFQQNLSGPSKIQKNGISYFRNRRQFKRSVQDRQTIEKRQKSAPGKKTSAEFRPLKAVFVLWRRFGALAFSFCRWGLLASLDL